MSVQLVLDLLAKAFLLAVIVLMLGGALSALVSPVGVGSAFVGVNALLFHEAW